ncbi:MAG: hypothetical protein AAF791_12370, partial [Bacteroidota bacterium]
ESRHVGYGIHLLSSLIEEHGDPIWDLVQMRMNGLLMGAMQVVAEMLAPYGDDIPFGVTVEHFMMHAQGQFQKRYARLEKAREKARGATPGDGSHFEITPKVATAQADIRLGPEAGEGGRDE